MAKYITALFAAIMIAGCGTPSKKSPDKISTISLSASRSVKMSELFGKIEYIELPENFDYFFLDEILFMDGHYFFCDYGHTYKIIILDGDFNFSGSIEAYGEGPGEYQYISDACINESKHTIDILSGTKLFSYDLQGNFKEELKLPYIISKLEHLKEENYIVHIHPGIKSSLAKNADILSHSLLFRWNTKTNKLIPLLPNPYKKLPVINERNNLKKWNNDFFLTKTFTDTIYWLQGEQLHHKFHLELKGKMLPLAQLHNGNLIEVINNPNIKEKYIVHMENLYVNDHYLLTSYIEKNKYGTLIYNRKTKQSISATIFQNDIDNGLEYFHPRFLQDNIIFGVYPAEELMAHYEKNQAHLADMDNSFTQLAKKLDQDSGKILVLYHLKY